jgi:hypothetical protein
VDKSLQEQALHHEQVISFDSTASKRCDAKRGLAKRRMNVRHRPKTGIHSNRNAIGRGFLIDGGGRSLSFIGTSCRVAVQEAFFKMQPQCASALKVEKKQLGKLDSLC